MDYIKTYEEGGIKYGQDASGGIYKNNVLVDPKNYGFIPNQVGGSRDTVATNTPKVDVTPTGDQTYSEGGIDYKNVGGQIYKNGVLVDPKNYGFIPTQVGGTRVDKQTATTPEQMVAGKVAEGTTFTEGGITYKNVGGQIYKNGVLVPPENYKYIPSEVGGTRVKPGVADATNVAVDTSQTNVTDTGAGAGAGADGSLQYDSQYDQMMNDIVGQIWQRMQGGFQYDPSTDVGLQTAQKNVAKSTMEQMNVRGILNSTITQDVVAEQFGNLTAQYEQIARGKYDSETDRMMAFGGFISNLDSRAFDKAVTIWEADMELQKFQYDKQQDTLDRELQEIETTYNKNRDTLKDAYDRINERGYVDSSDSQITGLPVGMLSEKAATILQDRMWQEKDAYTERQQELYDTNKALQDEREMYAYKIRTSAAILKDKDEEINGTAEQQAKYNDLIDAFENPPRGWIQRTPNEILKAIAGMGGKDYYVNTYGITEHQYTEMKNYFDNKAKNPTVEKPSAPVYTTTDIKKALDGITDKYSMTYREEWNVGKGYLEKIDLTFAETSANKKEAEKEKIIYIFDHSQDLDDAQIDKLLEANGLPPYEVSEKLYMNY